MIVGEEAERFAALKSCLVHQSNWFSKALGFGGKETMNSEITLPETEPSTFKTFLNWIYTNRVEFEDGRTSVNEKNMRELVLLYVFADQHDTKDLRQICIDLLCQEMKEHHLDPEVETLRCAFESLPENDALHRLLYDCLCAVDFSKHKGFAFAAASQLPGHIIGRLLTIMHAQILGESLSELHSCDYHDHATTKEREKCTESFYLT